LKYSKSNEELVILYFIEPKFRICDKNSVDVIIKCDQNCVICAICVICVICDLRGNVYFNPSLGTRGDIRGLQGDKGEVGLRRAKAGKLPLLYNFINHSRLGIEYSDMLNLSVKCVDHVLDDISIIIGARSVINWDKGLRGLLGDKNDLRGDVCFSPSLGLGVRGIRDLLDQLSRPIDRLFDLQNSYEYCIKNMGFGFGLRDLRGLHIDRLLDLQNSHNFSNQFGHTCGLIPARLAEIELLEELYNVDKAQFNQFNLFNRFNFNLMCNTSLHTNFDYSL
jgi:hypothetical protein